MVFHHFAELLLRYGRPIVCTKYFHQPLLHARVSQSALCEERLDCISGKGLELKGRYEISEIL